MSLALLVKVALWQKRSHLGCLYLGVGYVSWVGKIAEEDAVIVQILYDLGAVPFVRTNVPQTMMVRTRTHTQMDK